MNRESEGKSIGIPYLAKNERDMGHPSFVRGQEADHCGNKFISGVLTQTAKPGPSTKSTIGRNGHASSLRRRRARGLMTALADIGLSGPTRPAFHVEARQPWVA